MRLFEGSKYVHTSRISKPFERYFIREYIFQHASNPLYPYTDYLYLSKLQIPITLQNLFAIRNRFNKQRPYENLFPKFQTAFILGQTIKRNVCLRLYRQRCRHNVYRWFHGLQLRLHRGCSASSVRIFRRRWLWQ